MRGAGLLLGLLCVGAAHAGIDEECKRYEGLQYPAADMPTAGQKAGLEQCKPAAHYYGIGAKVDHVQARLCAFVAEDGKPYLMMLYANGQGVPRNYGLAKKAACEASSARAEKSLRLEHLQEMESGRQGPAPMIDQCDDATSGFMAGYCASIQGGLVAQKRDQAYAQVMAGWTAGQRQAFAPLQQRAEAFFEARSRGEVDLSGTARGALVAAERDALGKDLLQSVRDFEAGRLPALSQADFVQADRELNEVYGRLRKGKGPAAGTTVTMDDIRLTQRAWLAYRDAWVVFGKVRYPKVPDFAWKAYFTQRRTGMLKDLLAER